MLFALSTIKLEMGLINNIFLVFIFNFIIDNTNNIASEYKRISIKNICIPIAKMSYTNNPTSYIWNCTSYVPKPMKEGLKN